jgi:GDPmannose 4,6-dehydratase
LQEAFQYRGLDWENYVIIDPDLVRPAEVPYLRARPDKIKAELGWEPKTNFQQLVEEMVEADG